MIFFQLPFFDFYYDIIARWEGDDKRKCYLCASQ